MLRARSGASILHCDHAAAPPLTNCAKKALNLVTRRRGGTFHPDEIEIQEAYSKHRKLDS
jgi:hypothetical protein